MVALRVLVSSLVLAAPVVTQSTGRTLLQIAPPILGYSAVFELTFPIGAAGSPYGFLMCIPQFAGTYPISAPGVTFHGALRINPVTSFTAFSGVLGASGSVQHVLPIPSNPSFVGLAWEMQSADLSLSPLEIYFSDNDLPLSISSVPPAGLVPIAPGTFAMGSNATTAVPYLSNATEGPVHQVTISRAFWIGAHEVTQAEYLAVMGVNPSRYQGPSYPNAAQRPVEQVTWTQAVAYCQALTAIEQTAGRVPSGYQYRLPTEAEWEYCCRAGTTSEFSVGPSLDCAQASFYYSYHTSAYCGQTATSVVGSYAANPLGIHDMHGNVTEWCLDAGNAIVGTSTYPSSPVVDPYVQSGPDRVYRGGSYGGYSFECRSAYRSWNSPSSFDYTRGFRVVLGPIIP